MTLQSQDQLVFYKKVKVQELLLLSLNSFSLPQMGSSGGGGTWVLAWAQGQFSLIEGFRTNLLTEMSFPMPAYKNLSPFCLWQYHNIGKATSGLNSCLGVGLAAWRSHTRNTLLHSSAWCTLPHSSGLSRNVSLCSLPDLPRQRDHLFFPVLAVLWTVLYFYPCYIEYILFASTTAPFVVLWTSGRMGLSHFSLFPLCWDQWLVQSTKITQWYFWKNDYCNRWVVCDGLRNAFSSAREPIYKQTFGI